MRERAIDERRAPDGAASSASTPQLDAMSTAPPGRTIQEAAWRAAVAKVQASGDLREDILRSVTSSMAIEGFEVDRETSERLLEEALSGPPLVYPGKA